MGPICCLVEEGCLVCNWLLHNLHQWQANSGPFKVYTETITFLKHIKCTIDNHVNAWIIYTTSTCNTGILCLILAV